MPQSNQLVLELEIATGEALGAAGDLARLEAALARRQEAIERISRCGPRFFSAADLTMMRSALEAGFKIGETLRLVRAGAASDWHRLKSFRSCAIPQARASISLSA